MPGGIDTRLVGPDSKPLHSDDGTLAVTTEQKAHSHFVSVALATIAASPYRLVTPISTGTIEITDLLLTAEEKANGSIVVQFNDGTDTAIVATGYVATRTLNLFMPFIGRVQGWRSAYLEASLAGDNFAATVTVVYIKHPETGPDYAKWNSLR